MNYLAAVSYLNGTCDLELLDRVLGKLDLSCGQAIRSQTSPEWSRFDLNAMVEDARDEDQELRLIWADTVANLDERDADAEWLSSAGRGTDEDYGGDCERF